VGCPRVGNRTILFELSNLLLAPNRSCDVAPNSFALWSEMEKDSTEDDRRLQIARSIAMKTFNLKKEKKVEKLSTEGDQLSHPRGVGTNEIIRNSKYQQLYTMEIERAYMTRFHFQNIISDMLKMSKYSTVSTKSFLRTLREGLKVRF
jgi:hypothetical protein